MSSRPPTTSRSGAPGGRALLCNKCRNPLATTCFLCACDCIFCEECTYAHFEQSSNCPSCGHVLSENDFTELVVADSTSATVEIMKTSLQALFTKTSSSSSLPFSDLCNSFMRQIDVVKVTSKFLLKQFLKDASTHGRQSCEVTKAYNALKQELTHVKQSSSTERLQLEQTISDLQNKLQARDAAFAELQKKNAADQKMLDQFRRLHSGGMTSRSHSATQSRLGAREPGQREPEPPLKGLMQKQARERAQKQALQSTRAPSVLGRASPSQFPMKRSASSGHHHSNMTPIQAAPRPFSSNSTGSIPGTPRIRDLSSSAGYVFTSSSGGGRHGSHPINKRRRTTPSSSGGVASVHQTMSPSTAFTLNRGPQSGRGSQSYFHRGHSSGSGGVYGRM